MEPPKPLLKEAGLKTIRFHDLRYTSATLALPNGDNVKIVAERLGHSSAKMTLDVQKPGRLKPLRNKLGP